MAMKADRWAHFMDRGDAPACVYCGIKLTPETAVGDHAIPQSRGGKNGTNVVLACARCDHDKADRTPDEFAVRADELAERRAAKTARRSLTYTIGDVLAGTPNVDRLPSLSYTVESGWSWSDAAR